MKHSRPRVRNRTIRSRVLMIMVIPSVTLLILGTSTSGYVLWQANEAKGWASRTWDEVEPGTSVVAKIGEERRLSLLRLRGDVAGSANLEVLRGNVDTVLSQNREFADVIRLNPGATPRTVREFARTLGQIQSMRQAVDARQVPPERVYAFYNQLVDALGIGMHGLVRTAPEPDTAAREATANDLLYVVEAMSRSNALAASATAGEGLSAEDLREFRSQSAGYHVQIDRVAPLLDGRARAQYAALVASPAWQQVRGMEIALNERGPESETDDDSAPLPMNLAEWQNAAGEVSRELLGIWRQQHREAQIAAVESADETIDRAFWGGLLALLVSLAATAISWRLSETLINRVKRLREETQDLADHQLPALVSRLRVDSDIDVDNEVARLSHGEDEVGDVANAFNSAQSAAVMAAMREARTREGMSAVFLNIAYRTQVFVRRQLQVLDEAERNQDDPAHLELLLKLDHLATRARRNSENLAVLVGERPGRRWRKPMPLTEIVRGAISESEEFGRVNAMRLPTVDILGSTVTDLMHLLAELIDNATSYSPPDSRVEVRGNLVGKGVVVEVEDQGMGIPLEDRERLNATLHEPPEFEVMALSSKMRLGLFVVAKLAAQHGIVVTLTESAYGGVHAVVLIPTPLMATKPEDGGAYPSRHETCEMPQRLELEQPEPEPEPEPEWEPETEPEPAPDVEEETSELAVVPHWPGDSSGRSVDLAWPTASDASDTTSGLGDPGKGRDSVELPNSGELGQREGLGQRDELGEFRAPDRLSEVNESKEISGFGRLRGAGGLWTEPAEGETRQTHGTFEQAQNARPQLPRRRHRTSGASRPRITFDATPPTGPNRSPEQAHDWMAAMVRGTRRGRGSSGETQQ